MQDIGSGDKLARGAHSAQFEGPKVSQDAWNNIWGEEGQETEIERLRRKRVTVTEEESAQIEEEKKEEAKIVEEFRQVKKEIPKTVPFRAVQDRIVVVRIIEEESTEGPHIETPDEAKEKPSEGVVVAVGPGKYVQGLFVPTSTQVGERVMFGKYAGQEVTLGRDLPVFLVLREEDIFLVRNSNQVAVEDSGREA